MQILFLSAAAVGAGFLSGLLGAGGGIILYFVLCALYKNSAKENMILTSTATMFFSIVSLFFYKGNANADTYRTVLVCICAAIGGIAGASLMQIIPARHLKKLFAVIVIISGILMILR